MALWYLCTLLFTIFSGLYFVFDKDRLTPSEDYQTAVAGLFDSCRHAAVTNAIAQPLFGAAPVTVDCNTAYMPAGGIPNMNIPGIQVRAQLAALVMPSASGRMIITYIPLNAAVMNGIPFNEAVRQIRTVYGRENSTGLVADTPDGHRIDNGNGTVGALIPADIPTGSFANIRLVN